MIIFGVKTYQTLMVVVTLVCGSCRTPAAQRVEKRTSKFSLFFIPLFPVSTKYVLGCALCGATGRIGADEATRLAASGPGSSGGQAGGYPQVPALDPRRGPDSRADRGPGSGR